ncbi:hypothetical protein CCR75_005809 [Bremia lactucae]|uniref:Uncharacterized protein n=1 Tax=Bremia lactucae TaxID=4779 RepID=A0A976IFP9_BRELC|nr:hypothetical protein CCR75_005809 [Bremia lactucae]
MDRLQIQPVESRLREESASREASMAQNPDQDMYNNEPKPEVDTYGSMHCSRSTALLASRPLL